MVEMMSRHVQLFMEKFEYGAADDRRMISLPENESVNRYHDEAKRRASGDGPCVLEGADKGVAADARAGAVVEPRWSTHCLQTTNWVASPETHSSETRATPDADRQAQQRERKGSGSAGPCALPSSNAKTALFASALKAAAPASAAEGAAHSGVLLHSVVGTSPAELRGKCEKNASPNAAAAAVSAAAATAVNAFSGGGTGSAWWSGWTFWLSPEDDREMLAASAAAAGASAASLPGVASSAPKKPPPGFSQGGTRRLPESSNGDGGEREQWDAPPPYWNATFPHLYETRRTCCAKIVEVDRC